MIAQVIWHKDLGADCYEFNRVYHADGALEADRSFWLLTPLDEGEHPLMRQLTFAEYKSLYGRAARSYEDFASPEQPAEVIRNWFRHKYGI